MAERISALHGDTPASIASKPNQRAREGEVVLREVHNLRLYQICAWHDTAQQVAEKVAQSAGVGKIDMALVTSRKTVTIGTNGAVLPIAPVKWWLVGALPPSLTPAQGATLDLSHSRTHVRISGPCATQLLNRYLPLDLRPQSFPVGTVAASAVHHVGITMWHSQQGYELFIPRSFALSIWEMLVETATQFGMEIA